jgi:CubicO group peptidase (beta-lactamase class C family)
METEAYYPLPESKGGWRWLKEPDEVRAVAGMDPEELDLLRQREEFLHGGHSWAIVIIRHGYLVREFYTFNVLVPTRFDIWSGTKSFTGTAWGMLLEDSRQDRLPGSQHVELDSPAYAFIPEGHPLTDPRKERITIRHLLTMTSGIAGEKAGVIGIPTATEHGPFEHALGRCPNRYGRWTDKLAGEPGARWDYSDPAFAHLALAFANISGQEMSDYLQERVLAPIGVENLIPRWWLDLATKTSQDLNPDYGYTWWVNTQGTRWPGLPKDAFALCGYRANYCCVIPSLDMVVARVGSGPPVEQGHSQALLGGIVGAIIPDEDE